MKPPQDLQRIIYLIHRNGTIAVNLRKSIFASVCLYVFVYLCGFLCVCIYQFALKYVCA